jgi:hypothetical protein
VDTLENRVVVLVPGDEYFGEYCLRDNWEGGAGNDISA